MLEVLPRQAAQTTLARSLRDPSPEVRVLSLQGLGNILFHPEKVRAGEGGVVAVTHPPHQSSWCMEYRQAYWVGILALSLSAV